ncbi:MAG: PAS domain-containing protein [Planctomycetes bacterium]|nr:PAS domain-containing protein [Planctomycetota bacterium]
MISPMSLKSLRRRVFTRGEGVVALSGLALGGVLIAATAVWSWWAVDTQQTLLRSTRHSEIESVCSGITSAAERLVARNDLSALRTMVTECAQQHDLRTLRVALPNGHVIADADPKQIDVAPLPESWTDSPLSAPQAETLSDSIISSGSAVIPGRGAIEVTAAGSVPVVVWNSSSIVFGAGAIGAASLAGLWLMYRYVRGKTRALSAVRECLMSVSGPVDDPMQLKVPENLGPEAVAWNQLLHIANTQRTAIVAERAAEVLRHRTDNDSELVTAIDSMSQGVVIFDETGRVRHANGAAGVLLGVRRDALIGLEVDKACGHAEVQAAIKGMCAGQIRQRRLVEATNKSAPQSHAHSSTPDVGVGVLRYSMRPVRREEGVMCVMVIEDITQQRAADEARNAFVAHATHELRTPLTNIRLYIEQLIDDDDAAARANALNVVNQEVRRLERIITDMLSVSEIEAGTLQIRRGDVRLDALLTELEADFKAQAHEKEITLTFQLPPKLPVLQGDRDKVAVALHNLVGNALKYTPQGGQVTVRVEHTAQTLSIEVVDNGIGIKSDEAEMVFEKFYRAKDKRVANITGTGLGLTLARQVIRLHGGDITVKSQLDKGTTFTVTLPAIAA